MATFQATKCDQCGRIEPLTTAGLLPNEWHKLSIIGPRTLEATFCSTKCNLKWLRDKEKVDKSPEIDPDLYCRVHCVITGSQEYDGHDPNCPHGKMFPR